MGIRRRCRLTDVADVWPYLLWHSEKNWYHLQDLQVVIACKKFRLKVR